MQFNELNIMPSILKALEAQNYETPTPIQEKAIPVVLSGTDLLGCAQTGTGKTAAFAIPTLQLLSMDKDPSAHKNIRSLIITPTRELALQIYESFCTYGKFTRLKYCVVFGGVSQKPQEEVLQRGVDILIATPGRLNDLMSQRLIDLSHLKILILDEADRMLDMGFINDVKKIIAKTPAKKQTLFFSATMPPDIAELANTILVKPTRIDIAPVSSTVDTIEQTLYYVDKENKKDLLVHLLKDSSIVSALVFTRTKHGADRIVKQLAKDNITAQAIHGDKSQGARQTALNNFKKKTLRVLIATDIAARGIDIDELSHVINYDLPNIPETYVHRIGRTGRAGLSGIAISFCDFDEKEYLADIERLIGKRIPEVKDHPYPLMNNFPSEKKTQPRREPRGKAAPMAASKNTDVKASSPRGTASGNDYGQKQNRNTAPYKKSDSQATGTQSYSPKKTSSSGYSSQTSDSKSDSRYNSQPFTTRNTSEQRKPAQASTPRTPSTPRTSSAPSNHTIKPADNKKKKFRMTADGQLKEKKTKIWFPKFRGKSDSK